MKKNCEDRGLLNCSECIRRNCGYVTNLVKNNKKVYLLYRNFLLSQCELECHLCVYRTFCFKIMENVPYLLGGESERC